MKFFLTKFGRLTRQDTLPLRKDEFPDVPYSMDKFPAVPCPMEKFPDVPQPKFLDVQCSEGRGCWRKWRCVGWI